MDDLYKSADYFKHRDLPLVVETGLVTPDEFLHQHEFLELVYVQRGHSLHVVEVLNAARHPVRSELYELLPGDCFLVAPNERHAFRNASDGMKIYNILFLPELIAHDHRQLKAMPGLADFLFLEPMFRHETRTQVKLHLDVEGRGRVVACLDAIIRELGTAGSGFKLAAHAQFLLFLVELARTWERKRQGRGAAPATAGQRQAIDAALAFIEESYGQDLSLKSIAERAFLGPHQFSALFKRQCGMSPWEFLVRLRLDRAKELLRNSDRSVTDIAHQVGFADGSYFVRVFKAQVGTTPRRYRLDQPAAGKH